MNKRSFRGFRYSHPFKRFFFSLYSFAGLFDNIVQIDLKVDDDKTRAKSFNRAVVEKV